MIHLMRLSYNKKDYFTLIVLAQVHDRVANRFFLITVGISKYM